MPVDPAEQSFDERDSTLAAAVAVAERDAIVGALRSNGGSRDRAAEALAISATTRWRKMTRLGIDE